MNNVEEKVWELIEKMQQDKLKIKKCLGYGFLSYSIGDRISLEAKDSFSVLNINNQDEVDMGYEKYTLIIDSHYFDSNKNFFNIIDDLYNRRGYNEKQNKAVEIIQDEIDKISIPSMKM